MLVEEVTVGSVRLEVDLHAEVTDIHRCVRGTVNRKDTARGTCCLSEYMGLSNTGLSTDIRQEGVILPGGAVSSAATTLRAVGREDSLSPGTYSNGNQNKAGGTCASTEGRRVLRANREEEVS